MTDNLTQITWLTERAGDMGFPTLDELLAAMPAAFWSLARDWRRNQKVDLILASVRTRRAA